jgi:hypothetical protein
MGVGSLSASLKEKIGITLETYRYKVESGKIREFALAIGELNKEFINGEKMLPTFPTVIDYWGGGKSHSELLGFKSEKVLHGEQEYEYIKAIKPGDVITIKVVLENVYRKSSMNFAVIRREYFNENGDLVLISRATVIERD